MVLAGGGFRFGIYLGMAAAAREAGRPPDLLLSTCGGSMAAVVMQALPDDAQRQDWLCSPEVYRFWCDLQPSSRAGIGRALRGAVARWWSSARAPRIPDLFQDYLFEVPARLPLPAASATPSGPSVAIVGGRLLFTPEEVLRPRGQRKLFVQTVFCDARAAALLDGMVSPFAQPCWGEHAVADRVVTEQAVPREDAVRISIADCFYFPCHAYGGHHYTGGMVDLFPVEVARRLAQEVTMEFKQSFDQAASIPAWRAVLGLDGNQRLRQVHGQAVDRWVDTSDVSDALAREQVQKQLDWRRNRIRLQAPADHDTYVSFMQAQWRYGYERGREAFQRQAPLDLGSCRQVDRHNRPLPCG